MPPFWFCMVNYWFFIRMNPFAYYHFDKQIVLLHLALSWRGTTAPAHHHPPFLHYMSYEISP